MSIFLTASRRKYRFASDRGELTTEQLWDLPLVAKSGFDLNNIAKAVNSELKSLAEESFVETTHNPRRVLLEGMLEVVKTIIAVKQTEAKEATDRAAKAALKSKLHDAIERKKDQAMDSASIEELQAQLAALS